MTARLVLVLAFFLSAFVRAEPTGGGWSDASAGWPMIEALAVAESGLAGPVWAIDRLPTGETWIGGDRIAMYDGTSWREVAVPGGHTFRGLAADSATGRVWIGGEGELGFLQRAASGDWSYTSLRREAESAGLSAPFEVWRVALTKDGVVFVTEQHVLRWREHYFEVWSRPCQPRLLAHATAGGLFLHQHGTGLLRMGASGPELVCSAEQLPPGLMVWLIALDDGGFLLGTNDGAFLWRDGAYTRLGELSEALVGQWSTCAVRLDERMIAVGTYQRGIVLADTQGRVRRVLDRAAGFTDDRVNTLHLDPDGRLWVGLSVGLASFEAPGGVSVFDRRNGLTDGPVRRVFQQAGSVWAVTSRRLYGLEAPRAASESAWLRPEGDPNTYVWSATPVGPETFIAGFGGLWRGSSGVPWVHEHHVSADVFAATPARRHADLVYFLEGRALKMLVRTEHGWAPRPIMADLGSTPVSLVEDAAGDVWVATMRPEILRFRLISRTPEQPFGLRLTQRYAPRRGLPAEAARPRLVTIADRVVAFTETDILLHADDGRGFVTPPETSNLIGLAAISGGPSGYWLVQRRDLARLGVPALVRVTFDAIGGLRFEPVRVAGLSSMLPLTSLDLIEGGTSGTLWLGSAQALLRTQPRDAPEPSSALAVQLGPPSIDPIDQASTARRTADGPVWPASTRSVTFAFAAPGLPAGEPVFFESRFGGGADAWSPPQREAERIFTSLAPGRYTFEVRAIDRWGRSGTPASYGFSLAVPWYRQGPALAGYIVVGVIILGAAGWFRMRRLERHAAQLNALVEARTRELAVANQAKGEFLENISHEIRNPLNGIIGLVTILREATLGPRETDLAQSLAACARALTRVFDEVLNFTRIEHGQVPVHDKPFSLTALVADVVALFRATAHQRGSDLVVRREGSAPDHFVGDEEKIKSILGNFVANALKYAPGSSVEIMLQCTEVDDHGAEVTFNVTDHGPGIPPEEQELIFEKFVRGSQARTQRAAGTGLGLAACRALAGLLGGHVGVESEPGRGATFFLTLRLVRDRHPEPAAVHPATPHEAATKRALVVEDQPYNQIVMRRLAEKLGYLVDVAPDARDALGRLAGSRYAVVFLDWELPDLKGGDIARQLRAQPGGDEPILIATTAHDSDVIRRECLAAGIDAFALKPFELETIARLLDDARARRARTEPAGTANGPLDLRVFEFVGYGDPQQSAQAAALYLEILERELAAFASSCAGGDVATAAKVAHRLKSHAGLVDAGGLREAADRFQRDAATASPEERAALEQEVGRQGTQLRYRFISTPHGRAAE